jgi:hypothetical protein
VDYFVRVLKECGLAESKVGVIEGISLTNPAGIIVGIKKC